MDGYKSKNLRHILCRGLLNLGLRDILKNDFGSNKVYCFGVWSDLWSDLEQSKKEWFIFRALYSISPSLDGKIRSFDVQDYGFITEYFVRAGFGPYWIHKDGLPSLLDSKGTLPLILPMDDDD